MTCYVPVCPLKIPLLERLIAVGNQHRKYYILAHHPDYPETIRGEKCVHKYHFWVTLVLIYQTTTTPKAAHRGDNIVPILEPSHNFPRSLPACASVGMTLRSLQFQILLLLNLHLSSAINGHTMIHHHQHSQYHHSKNW